MKSKEITLKDKIIKAIALLVIIFLIPFIIYKIANAKHLVIYSNYDIQKAELHNTTDDKKLLVLSVYYSYVDDSYTAYYSVDGAEEISGKVLSNNQIEQLKTILCNYSNIVSNESDKYWPDSDEYPAMPIIFSYNVIFRADNSENVDIPEVCYDGALAKPTNYDKIFNDIVNIIKE